MNLLIQIRVMRPNPDQHLGVNVFFDTYNRVQTFGKPDTSFFRRRILPKYPDTQIYSAVSKQNLRA